ncbi:hypothetical protein WMF28_03990 [Sorangium sp. So ce590]|uniref:hypothetical protein n=1 Tax=Sorangium sp. So ce590 TaxID=3133317 RepID=UPI003F5D5C5C
MRTVGLIWVLGAVLSCSKAEPAGTSASGSAGASASTPAAASAAASQSAAESAPTAEVPSAPTAEVPSAPTAEVPSAPSPGSASRPSSFKGGAKENIESAVGLGCEAVSLDGWLQFLCRKKNGTGGHPKRALIRTPGGAEKEGREPAPEAVAAAEGAELPGEELFPNEYGDLTVVVPFSGDERRDVTLEWSDTRYTLEVSGSKARLVWAGSGVPHRRGCAAVLEESKAALQNAQKLEPAERLTATEATKLPRFGVCHPAGLGSWALALKAASAQGEGATRSLRLELEVVRVDIEGQRKTASFGALSAAPGGLEISALQVYDYDDDGNNELIVPYELKANAGASPAELPAPIWSFDAAGIKPYARAPRVSGGVGVEHLDFDMRPDLGSYGGFVAWLGADCGLKTCPARVTGPKLYFHALPDGGFSETDDAARGALKRACPNKPAVVVVEVAGSLNAAQTAKNLVCARAHGVSEEELGAQLAAKHALLCNEAAACPLETTLSSWLKAPLNVALPTPVAKK